MQTRTVPMPVPVLASGAGTPIDASGFYPSHFVQVGGTFSATYHVEASIDGGKTWFDANELAGGSDIGAQTTAKNYVIAAPARLLRINVTAYTSGQIVANYMGLDTRVN
jgi:hypothetical protein